MKTIEQIVKESVSQFLVAGDTHYDENDTFENLGADDLDVVEMFMEIEEALGVDEIPDDDAKFITTPAELTAWLKARIKICGCGKLSPAD